MVKLTSQSRNALPTASFAGPNRTYPIPDKNHAANAKARATQAVNAGRMSGSTKAKIVAKANKVLAHSRAPSDYAHHQPNRSTAHS